MAQESNQFLTFTLDKEIFAIEIESVREILEMKKITRLPQTSKEMLGVINLRDHAVPVFDLRTKFQLAGKEDNADTNIIILDITYEGRSSIFGVRVDSVREVLEISPETIEPVPATGLSLDNRFIKGMGRQDNGFVILLDSMEILNRKELASVYAA